MVFDRFKKKPSISDLEERRELLTVEEECVTKEAEIAERRAVISELKKRYGSGWAKTLGISKFTDLSTLKSFLQSAKQGIESQARSGSGTSPAGPTGTPVSRTASFKGITKA